VTDRERERERERQLLRGAAAAASSCLLGQNIPLARGCQVYMTMEMESFLELAVPRG
jgi:hypothetical protein